MSTTGLPPGHEFYHSDPCGVTLVLRSATLHGGMMDWTCPQCGFPPEASAVSIRPRARVTVDLDGDSSRTWKLPENLDELNPQTRLEGCLTHDAAKIMARRDHVQCPACNGEGTMLMLECLTCRGSGQRQYPTLRYYGKDVFDPEARCTREAFDRQLARCTDEELTEAYRRQETELFSAADWLRVISDEIIRRQRK